MDKFEFVAVLVSIIFGVAITNLLSGMLRSYFRSELSEGRLSWSLAVGMVLVTDWWVFFRWSDNPEWSFSQFLFLVFWSTVHYLLAVSIYPYAFMDIFTDEMRSTFLLRTMLIVLVVDVAESIVRGELFSPWYYPLFMVSLCVFALIPLLWKKPEIMRLAGWAFFFSLVSWATLVRSVLAS